MTPPTDAAAGAAPMDARRLVDYARSLDCIHCGLCLHTCPTYRSSGAEASSPRGRIHLMRAVAEGRLVPDDAFAEEMDFCLVCRHCESVCPAGVEFGAMMEFTRDGLGRTGRGRLRRLGLRVLEHRWALGLAATALRLAQRTGLLRLAAPLLGRRGALAGSLPTVPGRRARRPLPARVEARGEARVERAWLLQGCAMRELFGDVHRATARVLAALGVESRTAPDHVCCGALHAHNGDLAGARRLARRTIEAFDDPEGAPVVVNSAGCGAHMKEYARLLAEDPAFAERARAFARRVVDLSEHLTAPERAERLARVLGRARVRAPLVWDDPCHLCHGQGIRAAPRALLDRVAPGERAELAESESCCGSAGIYSLVRAADAEAVLAPRLAALRASGARTLVTANPGCQLQWASGVRREGLDVEVLHLAQVLERALAEPDGAQPSTERGTSAASSSSTDARDPRSPRDQPT